MMALAALHDSGMWNQHWIHEKLQTVFLPAPHAVQSGTMTRTRFHIAGLSRLLASAPQPVYALDADRTITFANAACEAWTGLAADSLLGRRCDYQSGYRSDGTPDPVHGLCPPPEAFLGRHRTIDVATRDAAGQWQTRSADCLPLGDEAAGCLGVLVVVQAQATAMKAEADSGDPTPAELHQRLRSVLRQSFEGLA